MKRVVKLAFGREPTALEIVLRSIGAIAIVVGTFWLLEITSKSCSGQEFNAQEQQIEAPKAKVPVEVKAETSPPKVKAIIVCCSDPRFDAFDRIRELYALKKGESFPIIVPGGPEPLANPLLMACKCEAEKTDLDIILEHPAPSIKMIIVAGHEDCACNKHFGLTDPHQGKKDFPAIAEFFKKRAPGLNLVMLYYSFTDQEKGLVNPNPEVVKID